MEVNSLPSIEGVRITKIPEHPRRRSLTVRPKGGSRTVAATVDRACYRLAALTLAAAKAESVR